MVNRYHRGSVLLVVSPGDAIDRLSILRLKAERIDDEAKLANVETELAMVTEACEHLELDEEAEAIAQDIVEVNRQLWDVEDELRRCERKKSFDDAFIALARSVYRLNDSRADAKRRLNHHLGAVVIEEKSYR
jgi:hypothetical protein